MHSRVSKKENATLGYGDQSSMNIGPMYQRIAVLYRLPKHELVQASGLDFDNILLNRDVDLAQTLQIVCHSTTHPKFYSYFTIDAWKINQGPGDLPLLKQRLELRKNQQWAIRVTPFHVDKRKLVMPYFLCRDPKESRANNSSS